MTRKDYILLANALRAAKREISNKEPPELISELHDGVDYARDFIMEALLHDNSWFDPDTFKLAIDGSN